MRARDAGARRGPREAAAGYSFPPGSYFDQQLNAGILSRPNSQEVLLLVAPWLSELSLLNALTALHRVTAGAGAASVVASRPPLQDLLHRALDMATDPLV